MKKGVWVWCLAFCCWFATNAVAQEVPALLSTQGVLKTAGGVPLPDGEYAFTFSLYNVPSGGVPLWSETLSQVPVKNGFFHAVLGAVNSISPSLFQSNKSLWLGVTVAGGPELPRQRLVAVGYAMVAQHAFYATVASGLECSGCVAKDALGFSFCDSADACVVSLDDLPCLNGQIPRYVAGQWLCTDDYYGEYRAGTGLLLTENVFSVDKSVIAAWAKEVCYDHIEEVRAELDPVYDNRFVNANGDTMTGKLFLPTDGLQVGTKQVVMVDGRVGVGTSDPMYLLDVAGTVSALSFVGDGRTLSGVCIKGAGDCIYSDGVYADPPWIVSLSGSKIVGNISGNAANVTGIVAIANGGTGANTAAGARANLGLGALAVLDAVSGGQGGTITDGTITDADISASAAISGSKIAGWNATNWDKAYAERLQWDGGATNLDAALGRQSLGLGALATLNAVSGGQGGTITDGTITDADISASAAISGSKIAGWNATNWDKAYAERLQWDGGATNLNAALGRQSLGLGALATLNAVSGGAGGTITDGTITNDDLAAGAFPKITGVGVLTDLTVTGGIKSPEWKLLARGSDWTEEAKINLSSSGATFQVHPNYSGQRLYIGPFAWPQNAGVVSEILFIVDNRADDYCVGGNATLYMDGGSGTQPTCYDLQHSGSYPQQTPNTIAVQQNDWIRLSINGVKQTNCPDPGYGRTNQAKYGHPNFDIMCRYQVNGGLTSLTIEEADWSADFSMWRWEIWYR